MPTVNLMHRLLLSLACLALVVCPAARSAAEPAAVAAADARSAVEAGIELERSRRWIDAIEHYEDALKRWPDREELQYGLRRSKIHFGVERRYADSSFESKLLRMSRHEALLLFDDVLQQVRTSYVDPVTPTSFVAHGTESLYLALANDKFVKRHLAGADPARVARLRQILREQYWNKPVSQPSAAREAVLDVCRLADQLVGLSGTAVVMEYAFGGCNALDDYSCLLTPNRLDDLYGNIDGEFVGLGIEMKAEQGKGLLLVNVLPESPAAEGGLFPGDYIVGIDGLECLGMTTDEAAKLLRGPSGTQVRLQVRGTVSESVREGAFVRRPVQVKSIPVARMVDPANGIGYIQMTGFQATTPAELDEALARLRRQGLRALVWDLRGNPGGLLTAAVEVVDRFIDNGVLVSTRGRTRDQNFTYSAHRAGTQSLPLVLLVDGESASASEIVAGAVADHKRGVIVGRPTYGKWSVQSIFSDRAGAGAGGFSGRGGTGLRLTTAKFYSPNGNTLGSIGVRPDHPVTVSEGRTTRFRGSFGPDLDEDSDLQKALEVLRSRLTRR